MTPDLSGLGATTGLLPEFVLAATILVLVVLDVALRRHAQRHTALLVATMLGLAASALSILAVPIGPQPLFYGMVVADSFAVFIMGLVTIAALVGTVFAALSPEIRRNQYGEYLILILCLTMGMGLLAASKNLLMIYLSLELVSLPSYILAGFRRGDHRSSEAALKYVIFGAAASGFMLYGFSLLYGMAGTLDLDGIGRTVVEGHAAVASPRTSWWWWPCCSPWPASPTRWRRCPSTCGAPMCTRARPRRSWPSSRWLPRLPASPPCCASS